jgi:hypothetical protein
VCPKGRGCVDWLKSYIKPLGLLVATQYNDCGVSLAAKLLNSHHKTSKKERLPVHKIMEHSIVRTQRQEFTYQVLPDLFHTAPDQLLFYLERDGIKVINFYWNESAKNLPHSALEPAYGLSFEVRKPNPRATVVLIGLSLPQHPGDAHFIALCYRPYRVMPFGWLNDTTKVLILERTHAKDEDPASLLVEISRRHGREELGPGPQPELEGFYQAVLAQIAD